MELDHAYDVPPDAVSVTDPPSQKVKGPFATTAGTGSALTVTVCVTDVAHPAALVIV